MKILETEISNLTRITIVNGLLQLTRANFLYTEKINPARQSEPVWKEGKATFTIQTILGDVTVESSALEWQVSRANPKTIKTGLQKIKGFLTQGCAGCKG